MAVYNPQDHIVSNKGFGVLAKPADARSWWTDGIEERPFASVAEVLAYFPTADSRKGNFLLYIGSEAYTFKGTADSDLIPFVTQDVDTVPVQNSTKPIASGYFYGKELGGGGLTYTNGKLYAGELEVKLNLEYFTGAWQAGQYQAGWLAVSTDRTKLWEAKRSFDSQAEPVAGNDWELLLQVPGIDTQPVADSANGIASGYVQQLVGKLAYYQGGQLLDAQGSAISLSVAMDTQPVQNSKKPVESGYFFNFHKTLPRYDIATKIWRDANGDVILKVDAEPVTNSPYPVASGYLYAQQQQTAYYKEGKLQDVNGNEIIPNFPIMEVEPYVHPETHPASMIEQDGTHRFVSDTQINRWNDTYTAATIENKLAQIGTGLIYQGWVPNYAALLAIANPQDNWTYVVEDASDDPNIGNKPTQSVDYRYEASLAAWLNLGNTSAPLVTQTVNGLMLAPDKVKLDGIEPGATKNATDAQLRNRATHTGTQAIATVEGLQAALDDTLKKGDVATDVEDAAQQERLVTVAQLKAQGTGTGYTEATEAPASDVVAFTNPFGQYTPIADPLSGPQTFTRTGNIKGATDVKPYQADGVAALTFDFASYPISPGAVSGVVLAAGLYEIYFSNRNAQVGINIIGPINATTTEPTPNTAPAVTNAIADQTKTTGFAAYTIDISNVFNDADGDTMTYTVTSQNTAIVQASLSGSIITLTGGGSTGSTLVTVQASDGTDSATDEFAFTVNAPGVTKLNAPTNLTATPSGETIINLSWTDTNS